MTVTVKEGHYYIDGHGEKRGPMEAEREWFIDDRGWSFYADGQRMAKSDEPGHPDHLVSEWVDPDAEGPVRAVTRREIVDGRYSKGDVEVSTHPDGQVQITVRILTKSKARVLSAAMVLSQLAEALDDA